MPPERKKSWKTMTYTEVLNAIKETDGNTVKNSPFGQMHNTIVDLQAFRNRIAEACREVKLATGLIEDDTPISPEMQAKKTAQIIDVLERATKTLEQISGG